MPDAHQPDGVDAPRRDQIPLVGAHIGQGRRAPGSHADVVQPRRRVQLIDDGVEAPSARHLPPTPFPPCQERWVGSFVISQSRKPLGLLVWTYVRPGPVSLTTRPSPPRIVDFQPPTFC